METLPVSPVVEAQRAAAGAVPDAQGATMRFETAALCLFLLTFPACKRTEKEAENVTPAEVVKNENPPATATEARVEGGLPNDRTPLEEPNGPIDPKSVEAAGQVVQHYGTLIEQGRWTEAWKLWSNADAAKQFDRNWRNSSDVHLEIGKPGDSEGAAGSIYSTMPVVFHGKRMNGTDYRERAEIVLRRVNDVPGSTEAQRRWHIENINFLRV
jgi:hypothetical protein